MASRMKTLHTRSEFSERKNVEAHNSLEILKYLTKKDTH